MSLTLLNIPARGREAADHMALSRSIDFAPHPMLAESDRRSMRSSASSASTPVSPRLCGLLSGRMDLSASRGAQEANGNPASVAADSKVSPKYLRRLANFYRRRTPLGQFSNCKDVARSARACCQSAGCAAREMRGNARFRSSARSHRRCSSPLRWSACPPDPNPCSTGS